MYQQNTNLNFQNTSSEIIHWRHFGFIMLSAVLLLGVSYMKKPELFDFSISKNQVASSDTNVPRYYAYVTPEEDMPQPAVLGASTNQGPSIIADDGTVQPVDVGQVLGASTKDVVLSLDQIKLNEVPDSPDAIKKYFSQTSNLETGVVSDVEFGAALNSGNQDQINKQAQKIIQVRDAEQKIAVPHSVAKLQKLKIIQYTSAIDLLNNFTNADSNPEQVNGDLQQFIKSQQDLDSENENVAKQLGDLDPLSAGYNSGAPELFPNTFSTADQGPSAAVDNSTSQDVLNPAN